jgi:hypothetical protein
MNDTAGVVAALERAPRLIIPLIHEIPPVAPRA